MNRRGTRFWHTAICYISYTSFGTPWNFNRPDRTGKMPQSLGRTTTDRWRVEMALPHLAEHLPHSGTNWMMGKWWENGHGMSWKAGPTLLSNWISWIWLKWLIGVWWSIFNVSFSFDFFVCNLRFVTLQQFLVLHADGQRKKLRKISKQGSPRGFWCEHNYTNTKSCWTKRIESILIILNITTLWPFYKSLGVFGARTT